MLRSMHFKKIRRKILKSYHKNQADDFSSSFFFFFGNETKQLPFLRALLYILCFLTIFTLKYNIFLKLFIGACFIWVFLSVVNDFINTRRNLIEFYTYRLFNRLKKGEFYHAPKINHDTSIELLIKYIEKVTTKRPEFELFNLRKHNIENKIIKLNDLELLKKYLIIRGEKMNLMVSYIHTIKDAKLILKNLNNISSRYSNLYHNKIEEAKKIDNIVVKLREKEKHIEKEVISSFSKLYEKGNKNLVDTDTIDDNIYAIESRFSDEDFENAGIAIQNVENREKAISEISSKLRM